ncbi:hypothetical protein HanRHA438_Chr13g0579211 [Helianthus annuus]|uniref:Uncharacterized protein n=1 Tax=Helianthus annuus TaxID=4232 RepID=A0A251SNL9_HELAN|nr:hypothetical protein HanXRQr2_Chr13g0567651 [Helianthus annuus]KAJ0475411.1 hypothetical protein HanHA300_Chr13g0465141 [Helianthus annuus]KAJ0479295.1 hypothetical protein HanIR_Chr13g0618401 [Helianthus annuus]KAJ0496215.1 hypothetical protein HanHA89_Chr13g0497171 [Helianthus annuus]KAJ0662289.1 hypothetical protein HanLR1_Chr13g0467751 [Helianthus annuus]
MMRITIQSLSSLKTKLSDLCSLGRMFKSATLDLSRVNLFDSKDPEDATVNDGRNLMEVNTKKNTRESFTC